MTAALATMGRGFADPVHGAQQVFRAVLEAMSRPGRVQALPPAVLAALEPPTAERGLAAVLLSLLDAETSAWLDPVCSAPGSADYLRFHTGVHVRADAGSAAFAVTRATCAAAALWHTLEDGSDELPQAGATLLVEVPSLDAGPALALRGPGIETVQTLRAAGLDDAFWAARRSLEPHLPRGIDLILTCGDRIAALPRSTRVAGA
ncbi:MAG: phosphonate C-P lyase system protein PhnH [Burkholderiaceae bacterium]